MQVREHIQLVHSSNDGTVLQTLLWQVEEMSANKGNPSTFAPVKQAGRCATRDNQYVDYGFDTHPDLGVGAVGCLAWCQRTFGAMGCEYSTCGDSKGCRVHFASTLDHGQPETGGKCDTKHPTISFFLCWVFQAPVQRTAHTAKLLKMPFNFKVAASGIQTLSISAHARHFRIHQLVMDNAVGLDTHNLPGGGKVASPACSFTTRFDTGLQRFHRLKKPAAAQYVKISIETYRRWPALRAALVLHAPRQRNSRVPVEAVSANVTCAHDCAEDRTPMAAPQRQRGRCLTESHEIATYYAQNDAVSEDDCLEWCLRYQGATGCEHVSRLPVTTTTTATTPMLVAKITTAPSKKATKQTVPSWATESIKGCYVFTDQQTRTNRRPRYGSGERNHVCWAFVKPAPEVPRPSLNQLPLAALVNRHGWWCVCMNGERFRSNVPCEASTGVAASEQARNTSADDTLGVYGYITNSVVTCVETHTSTARQHNANCSNAKWAKQGVQSDRACLIHILANKACGNDLFVYASGTH